jgi:hypothetical protein
MVCHHVCCKHRAGRTDGIFGAPRHSGWKNRTRGTCTARQPEKTTPTLWKSFLRHIARSRLNERGRQQKRPTFIPLWRFPPGAQVCLPELSSFEKCPQARWLAGGKYYDLVLWLCILRHIFCIVRLLAFAFGCSLFWDSWTTLFRLGLELGHEALAAPKARSIIRCGPTPSMLRGRPCSGAPGLTARA